MHEGYGRYAFGLYGLPIPDFSEDPHHGKTQSLPLG